MKLSTEIIPLRLKQPFTTAKDRTETSQSAIIRIEHGGLVGMGEAKMTADACGGSAEPVRDHATCIASILGADPFQIERILNDLTRALPSCCCTRAGVDIALHDLCGKLVGLPLYRWFGLTPDNLPPTSYTIGMDTIPAMVAKAREMASWPVLKIKVGGPGDVEAVRAIRGETDAVLRVDANGGWRTVEEAIDRIRRLQPCGIQFVEQPIPRGNPDGLRAIRRNTGLPIFADEDAQTVRDLPALAGCVDGINIKLMECGGIREAVRMIHVARALGMQVMLGCMVETSLSLTAAAHLLPLADYSDLDSALLLEEDPFLGFTVRNGIGTVPEGPGLGARPGIAAETRLRESSGAAGRRRHAPACASGSSPLPPDQAV
ncbi:MAG: dipeptide epimerase [Lentisphaeria bacterium]|nr:dipeptide epimerase [Lentisphaeria bacterium]